MPNIVWKAVNISRLTYLHDYSPCDIGESYDQFEDVNVMKSHVQLSNKQNLKQKRKKRFKLYIFLRMVGLVK